MFDNLSNASDSFLAELTAFVDTSLTSAKPKRVERDSNLQLFDKDAADTESI